MTSLTNERPAQHSMTSLTVERPVRHSDCYENDNAGGGPVQHSMTASVTDASVSCSSNEATGSTTCGTDAAGAASRAMDGE